MTGTGTMVGALLASLWWDNSTPGRIIIACIVFFIVRAGLATRQNIRRSQSENANLDRVVQHLERWRGDRQVMGHDAEALAPPGKTAGEIEESGTAPATE